jgi:hypothetical protein
MFDCNYIHPGFIFIPCPSTTPSALRAQYLIPNLTPKCECLSIHSSLPLGPRHHAIPRNQRKQSLCRTEAKLPTASISAESSEEIFLHWTGFVTKLGPQIRLSPVPIFGVNSNKRRKAGDLGVSSDEDPSPESSWSGDVTSAAVEWSDMSGSSSSSPLRDTEVSSSRRPPVTGCDKTTGSSSRQAARPAREDQRVVRPRAVPSGAGAPEPQRSMPRQVDPPRRSEERPTSARQLYDGSDRPDSDSLQRR